MPGGIHGLQLMHGRKSQAHGQLYWREPLLVVAAPGLGSGVADRALCPDGRSLRRYAMFVSALEECSRDNLDFIKERALKAIAALLRAKPEGEAALLTALVNKLGDPSRKLASKVHAVWSPFDPTWGRWVFYRRRLPSYTPRCRQR